MTQQKSANPTISYFATYYYIFITISIEIDIGLTD